MMNPSARAGRIRPCRICLSVLRQSEQRHVIMVVVMVMIAGILRGARLFVPLLMGSPLCGIPIATSVVLSNPWVSVSSSYQVVGFGAILWIVARGGVAAILFAAVAATFDRCLGRMPETGECRTPDFGNAHTTRLQSDLSDWLADDSSEMSAPV